MKTIKFYTLVLAIITTLGLSAQVSINTDGTDPDNSAMLDVQSTDKGMLIPRMTTAQRTAIASPATGLLVFDNETGSFWFYNGSEWTELVSGNTTTLSDADGDTKIDVEASADEDTIRFVAGNFEAMKIGGNVYGTVETVSSLQHFGTNAPGWQSFTAPANTVILSIEISYNTFGGYSTKSFKIYEGQGTGGVELIDLGSHTLSHGWNTIPLPTSVGMNSGQKYTIWFSSYAGVGYVGLNPYPDGQSSHNPNEDFSVRINYGVYGGFTHINTPLEVYGPVTATSFVGDGAGLTNLPGDNLGNHTATQNLQLNGNYLSGDGGNEGIFVTTSGNVGVGLNTADQRLHIAGSTQLKNGGLILTNDFTSADLTNFRRSTIDAIFNIANNDTLQKMLFKVSDGTYNGTRTVMTFTGNGHVGIGTTTPSSPLHIDKTLNNGTLMTLTNNGTGNANILKVTSGSNGTTDIVDIQNGAFVVEGNGNVGISTTSPDRPLTIKGTGTDSEWLSFKDNAGFTQWHINNKLSGLNFAETGAADGRLFLATGGNVGFGTTSPTQAKVVINGSASYNPGSYGYLNSSGNTGTSSGSNLYSLYANERIAASEFNAHSDRRIKNISGISNASLDLATLMQIQITNYTLRDTIGKGSTPQKKVIAQQVAEVYPQAVSKNLTEVIPDIYQRAEMENGWIMLATDLQAGERVKIITESGSEIYKVSAVENNRFQVAQLQTSNLKLQTVFVYGREVNDFHTVDYEAISMLNVSATQEQQRKIEELEKQVNSLHSQNSLLTQQNEDLRADVQKIKEVLLLNGTNASGQITKLN
ncbi:MAG TPA: tail fiber domain-containing protein [Bacteroidales bacterium]|nr:tail fiber domain-containing protein [Bacteroidales bacterium]